MKIDPDKNCHEYCPYGKQCRYLDGAVGFDYNECAMYYKIDDLMLDAQLARKQEDEDDEI